MLIETDPIPLLEREPELGLLRDACHQVTTGSGTAIALRGPPGIGKTALMARAKAEGAAAGWTVLTASGAELERDLAFGVARQLLEPPVRALGGDERESLLRGAAALAGPVVLDPDPVASRPEAMHAALHGLYWLTGELAALRPLLLAVDDLHWADPPSLRWLAYLGRRLEGVPVLLVMAMREAEPGTDSSILDRVLADTRAAVLRLEPFTEAGIERWLSGAYRRSPTAAFVHGCRIATGGNPFLLQEVTASLRAEGLGSDGAAASRLDGIAPASIAQSVLTRLAPLGTDAVLLAEAAAVLSTDALLERVAAVARLPVGRAADLADRLAAAEILTGGEPLAFRHPVLRSAVYDQTPPAWRGLAHLAAAELLRDDAERAGSHLLLAPAGGRAWVTEVLRAAGAAAVARGAPDSAVPLFRRAVDERPPGDVDLLLELAGAEGMIQDPAAAEHAELARARAATPEQRCRAALLSTRVLLPLHRFPEVVVIASAAESDAPDGEARLALQASAAFAQIWHAGVDGLDARLVALGVDELSGDTPAERLLLTMRAVERCARGRDRALIMQLTARVLSHEPLSLVEHEQTLPPVTRVLLLSDGLDEARRALDGMVARGRIAGAVVAVAVGLTARAEAETTSGQLADAEADAREAVDLAVEYDARLWHGAAVSALATVLIDRESPEAALALLARHGFAGVELPADYQGSMVLLARGTARAAAGRHSEAVADLRACGERQLAWGETGAPGLQWRPALALSLAALGERAEARRLAADHLRLAREFGSPAAIGRSLRACALVSDAEELIAGLREAERLLSHGPACLDHARTVLDLGAALRRAGLRVEARETLARALDATSRCGARALAERARGELHAVGARPRRERLSGPESLTAAERRVAELAARGLTNRQVAQALFVTTKTVEMHLGRTYAKLGIEGRDGLTAALAGAEEPVA